MALDSGRLFAVSDASTGGFPAGHQMQGWMHEQGLVDTMSVEYI